MNWFGIAGGTSIFLLIIASLFVPWWQVTVGSVDKPLANFGSSPLNMNISFLGQTFTFPLIIAINISVILFLLAGAIAILIYSINPIKPYAKRLLGFSYKKPLYALLIFIFGLIATLLLTKFVSGFDVPLIGSVNSKVNGSMIQSLLGGVSITNVLFTAAFQWPFYLAFVAVGLCIAAKLYDKKVATPPSETGAPAPLPPTTPLALSTTIKGQALRNH